MCEVGQNKLYECLLVVKQFALFLRRQNPGFVCFVYSYIRTADDKVNVLKHALYIRFSYAVTTVTCSNVPLVDKHNINIKVGLLDVKPIYR